MEELSKPALEWADARRKAFLHDVLRALTRRPVDLLPFEEVRQRLHLRNARDVGLQNVALDQIVGSTDRYDDFTREFLPRHRFLERRWERVDALVHAQAGLDPVELYQVGDIYFVRDGNHRVSVARQHGVPSIEARVWKYDARVQLDSRTDIAELLCHAARNAFLTATRADELCPHLEIDLSTPDGYDGLMQEITGFRDAVSQIDGRDVTMDEAVALWCELAYVPVVEAVRRRRVLDRFPDYTETDLYLWLRRNQEELEVRYGRVVLMAEAADSLVARLASEHSWAQRLRSRAGQVVGGVGDLGRRMARRAVARFTSPPEPSRSESAATWAVLCGETDETPLLRFRSPDLDDWPQWRHALIGRLSAALGFDDGPPTAGAGVDPDVEVDQLIKIGGTQRELVWLEDSVGPRLPAYLYYPTDSAQPLPVLFLFGDHTDASAMDRPRAGRRHPSAWALSSAGYAALAVEQRGFGLLHGGRHLQIDRAARLGGRSWLGMVTEDALRWIRYVSLRPEVNGAAIGAIGIGAGGAIATCLAALDERVAAIMVSSYLSKYQTVCQREDRCRCEDLPAILPYAEMGDVAGLIAPRPALYVNAPHDPNTPRRAARDSYAVAQRVYRALGVLSRIRLIEPAEARGRFDHELAVAWFDRWLRD